MAFAIGERLKQEAYRGYFELDLLLDLDTDQLYLGELNPRITGASSMTNHAVFALADAPLLLFHLLEWLDVDYELNVQQLNNRWARVENIDTWSQLVIKHTADTLNVLTKAPPTGMWQMDNEGHVHFSRYDTHIYAVERCGCILHSFRMISVFFQIGEHICEECAHRVTKTAHFHGHLHDT